MSKWRGYDPSKMQIAIAGRDGWICHYCGCELMDGAAHNSIKQALQDNLSIQGSGVGQSELDAYKRGAKRATIDHIVPISKGGNPNDRSNMVLSCQVCNSSKSTKSYKEFTRSER